MTTMTPVRILTVVVFAAFAGTGCAPAIPTPATNPTATPIPVATTPPPHGKLFDPLVRPVSFGWLPPDLTHDHTFVWAGSYEVAYGGGTELHGFRLEAWPVGLAPWQTSAWDAAGFDDTTPINGGPAQ